LGRPFRTSDIDWFLLGLALAIAAIGVVEIYSTTLHSPLAGLYKKQIYWILVSCFLAVVASRLDYHMVLEQTPWLYGASVLLLAGLLVAGHSIAGTRRWLHLGPMSFQVSEIVKLIIILVVAAYFADRRSKAVTWGDLVKLGIFAGIPVDSESREQQAFADRRADQWTDSHEDEDSLAD
jgi:rod shape determining protein RodA